MSSRNETLEGWDRLIEIVDAMIEHSDELERKCRLLQQALPPSHDPQPEEGKGE